MGTYTMAEDTDINDIEQPGARPSSERRALEQSQRAEQMMAQAATRRRKKLLMRRVVTLVIWLAVVAVSIPLALMASAWLTGFRTASGAPDVSSMVEWIKTSIELLR
jgi:hypothetical protein